ncbi:MAG: hypothetical protein OEY19_01655 [Gammaproteobacteria bacterium]|nr:hypothetical protein [Gammaproteobacteria bacterium]MDH5630109.1 hypothetical protein [Gammaproteobacteria bacterium]
MLKNIFSHFKKSDDERPPAEQLDDNKSGSSASTLNADSIKAIIADLNAASSFFKEAGFIMQQIEITAGQEPKITPQFRQFHELTSEEENHLLSQLDDKAIIKFVIMSLFKSSRLQGLFENTEMELYGIEICITGTPSVKTIFKRDNSPVQVTKATRH